jgi:hypothetical protein
LIYQNVKTAFTRVADTAGTNAHTTYGENISNLTFYSSKAVDGAVLVSVNLNFDVAI